MITFSLAKLHKRQGGVVKVATLYRPYRDWRYLLVMLLLAFLVSISASLYIFGGVRSGDLFDVTQNAVEIKDDGGKAALESVVNELEARRTGADALRERMSSVVDPS